MISAASFISNKVRSFPPLILKSTPLAPSIDVSKRGLEMASELLRQPGFHLCTANPISAEPVFCIMVCTSAKSQLITPGTAIKSDIPLYSLAQYIISYLKSIIEVSMFVYYLQRRSFGMVINYPPVLEGLECRAQLEYCACVLQKQRVW